MLCLQFLHPGRDMDGANGGEGEPTRFAPPEKPAACTGIGPARVVVVDVGREEFDEVPAAVIAAAAISAGTI
jgi:hypothetical protein